MSDEETTVVTEEAEVDEGTPAPAVPATPKKTVDELLAKLAATKANETMSSEDKNKAGRSLRRQLRAQGYSLRDAMTSQRAADPEPVVEPMNPTVVEETVPA